MLFSIWWICGLEVMRRGAAEVVGDELALEFLGEVLGGRPGWEWSDDGAKALLALAADRLGA